MSINKKPIPQRIYNASKSHPYVAGAVDIIDDFLNQNQQDINADTYRKEETYSQQEVNDIASAFTSQNYYTVEATDADTSIESIMSRAGVVPAKDTVYRVGFWDGTEYDESKYSEYAWNESGNTWKLLDVKEYTIATEDDFVEPDAQKRSKMVSVGAAADVYGYLANNPEWAKVVMIDGRVVGGIRTDGSVEWFSGVPIPIREYVDESISKIISTVSNPEYLAVEISENGRILSYTKKDGSHYAYNFHSETLDEAIQKIPFENIVDAEGRLEITKDANQRVLSYRKHNGILVENAGIETRKIYLSQEGLDKLAQELDIPFPETIGLYKKPNLPKFGTTNIKTETFYLTAVDGLSSLSQTELVQDFEDTVENAADRMTICHYYFNGTRLRHYAAGRVKLNSSDNKYYAKETIRKIDGVWYYADTLGMMYSNAGPRNKVIEGYSETYSGSGIPAEGDYALIQTEVVQMTGPANVNTWTIEDYDYDYVEGTDIGKKYGHQCIADVDFDTYFSKTNAAVEVKYQGNTTQNYRKRNFRYTFYKNSTFAKKDKIKIGEMLRLSKFNLKANWLDTSRMKELILYRILYQIWQNRPIIDRYNWDNKINGLYHGVSGNIQGFPIELKVNGEFYGIYTFCLPKDGKNYFIDDEDEDTGLFVSGAHNTTNDWGIRYPYNISEHYDCEMDSDDFNDYPMITMAIDSWIDFINNRLYRAEDGNAYGLFQCMFRGTNDVFYYYNQVSYDEETGKWYHDDVEIRNIYVIDMYWDSEHNVYHRSLTTVVGSTRYVTSTLTEVEDPVTHEITYEVNPNSVSVEHFNVTDELIPFDRDNIPDRLDVLGFIDYFICMQLFVMIDNTHNNMLMYSGAEKKKMFPFFYDLDGTIAEDREGGAQCNLLDYHVSLSYDVSFWSNFTDIYWDDIVNRYCQLRKTYLSIDYIKSVFDDIAANIPQEEFTNENQKWGVASNVLLFSKKIEFLEERVQWLDEKYFKV